jgi:hypothetical protein
MKFEKNYANFSSRVRLPLLEEMRAGKIFRIYSVESDCFRGVKTPQLIFLKSFCIERFYRNIAVVNSFRRQNNVENKV